MHRLEEICASFDLQPRGSAGEHRAAVGAKWDISNKQRLGFSEVQLVQKMVDGVKKLISIEEKLVAGGGVTGDPGLATNPLFASDRQGVSKHGRRISPWHQIPLWVDGQEGGTNVHFVCEVPQGTRDKFEIATTETDNPIHQDVKNGVLRSYAYGDFPLNYGALPQTWESGDVVDEVRSLSFKLLSPDLCTHTHQQRHSSDDLVHVSQSTGVTGDNDPLDAVEVSGEMLACGAVRVSAP